MTAPRPVSCGAPVLAPILPTSGERTPRTRSAGYRSARSTRMGWNGPDTDPYALRIIGVDDTASVSCLAADLGGFGWLRQRVRDLQTETPGTPRRGAPEPSRERAPVTEQPALTR